MKGCICLDIDGTITADPYRVPDTVIDCFRSLYLEGWSFVFVTGRTYAFALNTLLNMNFPYFFGVQNGADILLMPEKKSIAQEYLTSEVILEIEKAHEEIKEGFLIYSGLEKGDFCYYRPASFSSDMKNHLGKIRLLSPIPWQEKEDFCFSVDQSFPLIKSLGSKEEMLALNQKLKKIPGIEAVYIKDPLGDNVYLNLITATKANKGNVLKKIRTLFPLGTQFIAAGDDYNDVSLLKEADLSIVMNTAPEDMISLGDIIARSAKEEGIIEALLQATGSI